MSNIRLICAEILQRIMEEKVFFSELKDQLPDQDKAFANMLLLTSLRQYRRLDEVLRLYIHKKIARKHRLAHYLLVNASAELLFMKTPPHAVINETVTLVRQQTDKFLSGLANAVLRKIADNIDSLRLQSLKIDVMPESFLPILDGYNKEQIKKICQAINYPVPLDITVKTDPVNWCKQMNAELLPNGSVRLLQGFKVSHLPDYEAGLWWVQDVAATLPVLVMGNVRGLKVVDLCAAPGGKTAQLAARGAEVTAVDISSHRMEILMENMKRLKLDNVRTIVADACDFLQKSAEIFDMILLDAPCSASGTFRRHPEVLHIKTLDDVEKQVLMQKKILSLCRSALKPKGFLIYSVCSISQKEGEEQIRTFLKDNPEFKLIEIKQADISAYGQWADKLITPEGFVRTMPYYLNKQNGMDSFFICKMQRII